MPRREWQSDGVSGPRIVVLVSGGAAVTPFTTPDRAAATGLAAGNTLTALRARLLAADLHVVTAPARVGGGTVTEDAGWQGFGDVPEVLPAEITINSVGGLDAAGAALDGFLEHLESTLGAASFDLVGHSMGGLFARAAIGRRRSRPDAAPVRRLVTLGTPWTGALLGDFVAGDVTLADAQGDATTEAILREAGTFAAEHSEGAAEQVSERYLAGPGGWNARQSGALDGIDVTLVAGGRLHTAASPAMLWPHDGLVARRSALAELVPSDVLPAASRAEFDDVHSIFFADRLGLPWAAALTWDPEVLDLIERTIRPD